MNDFTTFSFHGGSNSNMDGQRFPDGRPIVAGALAYQDVHKWFPEHDTPEPLGKDEIMSGMAC